MLCCPLPPPAGYVESGEVVGSSAIGHRIIQQPTSPADSFSSLSEHVHNRLAELKDLLGLRSGDHHEQLKAEAKVSKAMVLLCVLYTAVFQRPDRQSLVGKT
eukprot:GHVQ01033231.1.p1 GENE.GHVQ01033231.1~~GHVQ01033231.1.p1  ORF type:complete len:102 (-),score=13.92 GHVQ01033231.1:83-388(-)